MDVMQTARLAPLLDMVRAAAGAADRTAFLPVVARRTAEMIDATACEIWIESEGPTLAASWRVPGTALRSPEVSDLRAVMREGEDTVVDAWLCVPLPPSDVGTARGVLAVHTESAPGSDEVALVEVAAAVARLGLDAADAGKLDAESRDEFLALLGHDLRSPLSNVRVGAQLAQRNLDAGDLDSVRQALKIIENQSGRLLERLEALLDAVAASGRWLIKLEPIDLVGLVSQTIEAFELAATESGAGTRFELVVAPGTPEARGDASQVGQVVEHLIDNAAKYAEGGRVEVKLAPSEGGVRMDVCDNGPGIRPEDVDRVFAPFGRGRNAGDKQGYGLGLYLARNIARAHGGRLWIARTSRSGTCMALTLPAAADGDAS